MSGSGSERQASDAANNMQLQTFQNAANRDGEFVELASYAPELTSRIWDISDGRLVNGMWARMGVNDPGFEPFGGTVHEFQLALEEELALDYEEEPGAQFLRNLREQERYRDTNGSSSKSAPVTALYGGSLPGVTRPVWVMKDHKGEEHEFGSEDDAVLFQKKQSALMSRKQAKKAKATAMSVAAKLLAGKTTSKDDGEGVDDEGTVKAKKKGKDGDDLKGSDEPPSSAARPPMAFDSIASITVAACRRDYEGTDTELKRRLRDVIDGNVSSEITKKRMFLRSQVQDALQVFAQVIEDEDAVTVCNFVNCLVMQPVVGKHADLRDVKTTEDRYKQMEAKIFDKRVISFELLRDEPVCMLGMAIKQQRPLKPRVVIVVERSIMENVLRALTSPEAQKSGGLRNLYPAAGWVVVPDGTDMALAKVNFQIALARVLKRHALGVSCGGGLNVLSQMCQAAIWDVPMMVLHGSGRVSDIWMKLWPRRTSADFDAVVVHAQLQSCAGYSIEMQSTHNVREVLKKGNLMLHSISANTNACERLFRIELKGDQLITTALRRLHSYEVTIRVYSKYKRPLATFALMVSLFATLASVFVSNLDTFGHSQSTGRIWAGMILRWIAVVAPAVLVVLNSIENFVNLNNMLIIAERASAKVESLLNVYRMRALQYSDAYIDKERDAQLETERLRKEAAKQKAERAKKSSSSDSSDDDDDDDGGAASFFEADDMDQETGDIVTVRQAKLAEILEGVNKDFSEAGAMLFELKNQLDPDQEAKVLPAKTKKSVEEQIISMHRKRVPSKSRQAKQSSSVAADPTKADDSDDDLNPQMMSPLHLARLEGNLDGLSNLGGLAGKSYGGQTVGGRTFESRSVFSQDPRQLGFDSRTLALPYASVNTPGQTLALPSSSDIAAQHLTPGQRMLLAGAAAEAGVDVPSTSAVSFDVPGVDLETPGKGKEIVTPGMEIETPGVDLKTPAVKIPQVQLPQYSVPSRQSVRSRIERERAAAEARMPKTPLGKLYQSITGYTQKASSKVHAVSGSAQMQATMGYLGLSKRKLSQKERASRLMAKAEFREFKESKFPVSSREYVRFRLSKTLTEFRNKHNELMVYSLMAQVFMYVLSALGSVLATIGMPEWVAITVALGQASQQWLRQNRVEERRIAYRQAAAEMADARMKWEAIPMEKRAIQENIDALVFRVEKAILSVVEPLPTQVNCPSLESLAHVDTRPTAEDREKNAL